LLYCFFKAPQGWLENIASTKEGIDEDMERMRTNSDTDLVFD